MNTQQTVFVVDDDELSRESVCAVVGSMGARSESFSSAEEFLAAYDPCRPGCLVSDVRMLGMDGLELQQRLVHDDIALPVIIITAYADVPLTVQAMKAGALTVLEKPYRSHDLWQSIRQALDLDAEHRRTESRHRQIKRRLSTLTSDERRLMELLIEGKPNKAIAREFDVGLRTVERWRHNMLRRMQVETVAQLTVLVVEAKLYSPP